MNQVDAPRPLPALREDIQLLPGPETLHGEPSWAIYDPIRNQYFRISWMAFELLSRWQSGDEEALLAVTREETTCPVQAEDVEALVNFLLSSQLTLQSVTGDSQHYAALADAASSTHMKKLFQSYLFLRIPLVRPDAVFQRIVPFLDPLFSTTLRNILLFLGLLGVFLISRQWDAFSTTFLYFYSLEGLLVFLLGIFVVKVCHELGHALTATRFGCRVASMGVAFLVFFPVLYTDTTDAYRLTSRVKRLYISAAGILTEFYIALICLFLWSLLPDGVLRSVVFILGTVSITLTILINLNPFMRFDGYYFLADVLGIENLQERSFAMGRWKLRELLLGLGHPPPESHSPELHRFLIGFAWATWVYRFFLLLGIAWLVYAFFFKLLGVILFAGVVSTFILSPILNELKALKTMMVNSQENAAISLPRRLSLAAVTLSVILLVLLPWRSSIGVQVIAEPEVRSTLYAPAAGQVTEVHVTRGDRVQTGQKLVTLASRQIAEELQQVRIQARILEYRLQRIAASQEDLQELQVLQQQLQENRSQVAALEELMQQLVLRSPIDGVIVDMEDSLAVGRWINPSLPVALIVDPESVVMHGYVPETELKRIETAQAARFIPDQLTSDSLDARVLSISRSNVAELDQQYHASVYGGAVAVRRDDSGRLVPESAVYRLKLQPVDPMPQLDRIVRGIVQIEGEPQSLLRRGYESLASAIVRGSAF